MSRPVIKTSKNEAAQLTAWAYETKEGSKIPVVLKGKLEMEDRSCQVVGFPTKNNDGKNPDISWEADKEYYKYKQMDTPEVPPMTSWINHGNISTSIGNDNKMTIKSGFDPTETKSLAHLNSEKNIPMVVCLSEDKDTKVALWPARRNDDNKLFLSGKMKQGEQEFEVSGNFIEPKKAGSATALINVKDVENQPMSMWINDFGSASIKGGPEDVDLKGGVHPAAMGTVAEDLRGFIEARREMQAEAKKMEQEAPPPNQEQEGPRPRM